MKECVTCRMLAAGPGLLLLLLLLLLATHTLISSLFAWAVAL